MLLVFALVIFTTPVLSTAKHEGVETVAPSFLTFWIAYDTPLGVCGETLL
jgi:hypothetical protein